MFSSFSVRSSPPSQPRRSPRRRLGDGRVRAAPGRHVRRRHLEPDDLRQAARRHARSTGLQPVVEIYDDSGAHEVVHATRDVEAGVYEADVVFPTEGDWRVTIHSGFGDSQVTYGPVAIGAPAGGDGGSRELPVVGLGVALLALARRRCRARGQALPAADARRAARSRREPASGGRCRNERWRTDRRRDAALAERARQGDERAFEELVRAYQGIAFRAAYLLTGSAADAEDAVQVGFVKAWAALGRFRRGAEFRPWLLRIVANEAHNRRRSAQRRESLAAARGRRRRLRRRGPVSGGDRARPRESPGAARRREPARRARSRRARLPLLPRALASERRPRCSACGTEP